MPKDPVNLRIYAYGMGVVCAFKYKRDAIQCLPYIARALHKTVWMVAPKNVMICDCPPRCSFGDCKAHNPEDEQLIRQRQALGFGV